MSSTAKRMLTFVGIFVAATTLHYLLFPVITPVLNRDINARSAAVVINTLTPSTPVTVDGISVGGGGTYVQIAGGCDGFDVLMMVLAAVIAFPMPIKRKLLGLLAATSVVYVLNISRIAALWYCLRYEPGWFDTAHQTIGQTVVIVAVGLFFAWWTGLLAPRRAVAHA